VRDCLTDIVSDDKRAGEVINRLRGLLKKGEFQASLVDLNEVVGSFSAQSWGYVFPAGALIALALVRVCAPRRPAASFLASSAFIAAMLSSAAFGLYPYVLPSHTDPKLGLTVSNAAAAPYGLRIGLAWWIPGVALAAGYFVFTYRRFAGKVRLHEEGY
jgi:cytochrome d ubiquinol oxidase subunit II